MKPKHSGGDQICIHIYSFRKEFNRRCKWMDISSLLKFENENKSDKESYKQRTTSDYFISSHEPFSFGDYLFAAASSAVIMKLDFPACLKY